MQMFFLFFFKISFIFRHFANEVTSGCAFAKKSFSKFESYIAVENRKFL